MDLYILFSVIALSAICTPIVQRIFININKVDLINPRSSHSVKATRTGGASSFLVIFIISLFWYLIGIEPYDFSLLVPISMMFIIGVYDDFYNADFKLKFFIQIIVAKMIIDQGLVIDNFYGVLGLNEIPRIAAQLFTIFVFLVIVNSINFIDGIDGLALTEVFKIILLFEFFHSGNSNLFALGSLTLASLLPLYFYNFKSTNKVFLGDAGSLFLGALIAIYTFYFLGPDYNLDFAFNKPLLSILILLFPLIDLLRVFIIRIKNKKSPFRPDNNHLHHILLNKRISHFKISLILPFGFLIIGALIIFLFKVL
ncbi:MAG: MraY family glycosyltransferase [Flavobacteriaceae bacterium]|nr:MraY family glycosyltransferase [Flavobacteriaceae bacterium]